MLTSEGLTDRCFSDRKTTLLSLAVLFLIGLSCALYFGKKSDDIKLSPEEAYAYGNYTIECYQWRDEIKSLSTFKIQFSGSVILLDDIVEYIKPHINNETGGATFQKWLDMLLPVDVAFVESDLAGVIKFFNESIPIVRDLALHVKNQQISVLLLHTSNEWDNLVSKLSSKRANFEEIYFSLFRSTTNFIDLSEN